MRALRTVLTTIGAMTVLVLAGNTVAIAATGQGFLLGKSNSANNITALTRTTTGSALKLQTLSSTNPPLIVNGKGKVANLNADLLDGLSSAVLHDRTWVFTSTFTDKSSVSFDLPLPLGSYLITYSAAFPGVVSTGVQCFVTEQPDTGENGTTTGYESQNYVASESWSPAVNGVGHATKTATQDIRVGCNTEGPTWSAGTGNPLTITATPTSIVSATSISPLE